MDQHVWQHVCVWAAGGGATRPTLNIHFIMIKTLCLCFQSESLCVQEKVDGDKGQFVVIKWFSLIVYSTSGHMTPCFHNVWFCLQ